MARVHAPRSVSSEERCVQDSSSRCGCRAPPQGPEGWPNPGAASAPGSAAAESLSQRRQWGVKWPCDEEKGSRPQGPGLSPNLPASGCSPWGAGRGSWSPVMAGARTHLHILTPHTLAHAQTHAHACIPICAHPQTPLTGRQRSPQAQPAYGALGDSGVTSVGLASGGWPAFFPGDRAWG